MKNTHHLGSWFWLLAVFASLPLMADETEIYFADKSDEIAPNVLFLIDASGSMSQTVTGTESRMDVLKSSFQSVMDTAPTNLNIGLMHYANHGLGRNYQWSSVKGVNFPITPIDGKIGDTVADGGAGMTTAYENIYQLAAPQPALTTPVRSFLSSLVNSWQADGYTPIVDSLYEAARYYRGDSVGWGKDLPSLGWAAHPLTYSDSLTCKSYNLADGSKSPPDSIPPVSPNNPKCIKEWGECKGDIVPNTCSEETWFQVDGTPPVTLTACEYLSCADYDTSTVIKYKSPIQYSCQANYLVLMSDGKPEYPYYPGMGEVDGTPYYPPSSERYPSTTGYAADKSSEIKVNPRLEDYMGLADCTDGAAMKDATGADIGYNSGVCGPELTEWLATNDQDGDTTNGDQVVKTFTVGFALNADASDKGEEYLQLLAQKGKGQYFPANNATELAGAFKTILNSISAASSSFSSPTYTVDANNMLAHSDEVYIPMFDRSDKPMWSGNLKKFKRVEEKQADGTFVSKIVDKNGNPAVNSRGELVDKDAKDDSGAAFTYDAQDFWGAPSGNNVAAGGAASQLPAPADRKLYTDVSTPTFPMDLTATTNALKTENTTLTNAMLVGGTSTTTDASKLFDGNAADLAAMLAKYPTLSAWAANLDLTKLGTPYDGISCAGSYTDCTGKKKVVWSTDGTKCVNIAAVTTCSTSTTSLTQVERDALLSFARGDANPDPLVVTPSKHIGDMLNTKPVVVDYGTAGKRIFAATNEGFLHSIDTDTGAEQWAFMPKSLLPNIQKFMANLPSEEHVYGVDGPLTLWENDVNKDGKIEGAGEQRILFFGLRRGGKAYYALDITSADAPKILWKKENTTVVDDAAWHELGETWSKPTLAKMRIGSSTSSKIHDVVVFGAGYDAFKDEQNVSARPSDEVGSDVMIVDALTGQLHWSLQRYLYNNAATANPIKHSIPGDIRVMDMDRNGTLDRLYFADTGGNVWRVDMDHDLRDTDADMYNYGDAILTHIAELGTDGDYGTDPRKFFYEPDVALIQHNGKVLMTIALGGGYRTHPLNTNTNDRFYVLMDPNVYNEPPKASDTPTPPNPFSKITNADLINARGTLGEAGSFDTAGDSSGSVDSLLSTNYKGWYYDFDHTGEKVLAPAVSFLNKVIFTTFAPVDVTGAGLDTTDPDFLCKVSPNSARAYVLDLFTGRAVADLDRKSTTSSDSSTGGKDDFVVAGVNEILDAAKIVFRSPMAADGGACEKGDCQQTVEIRVGKMEMPVMDDSNSANGTTGTSVQDIAAKTDLTDIMPRMFWRDHNVSD